MLTQSQLKEIFFNHGFRPLKRLGENYLIDSNIKDKIIAEASLKKDDVVLEIGAGFGALTIDIARSGARVYAVEIDKKAFYILKEIVRDDWPNLKLFHEDILKFDLKAAAGQRRIKVIGNLPYYITTPVIEYLIENRKRISSILVLVQREVANRLLASPGSEDYSSLSCFVRYHTEPAYVHTVKRSSFYPVPEVDSSLIRLEMLKTPAVRVGNEKLLFKIIRGSFNQRRKSIINSLSREEVLGLSKERLSTVLESIGIDPSARPESLDLSAFASIANKLG